jgi:hypothetical protein
MAEDKVFHAEVIEENPFPEEGVVEFQTSQKSSKGEYSAETIKPQPLPTRRVAHEVISSSLNTKSRKILGEFEFTQTGAIQIGKYENGVSGDVRLTPAGIVARNKSGTTTFALDGDAGSATFMGEIQAGAIITGLVSVGSNNIVIDGENRRMVFYDENDIPVILIGNA